MTPLETVRVYCDRGGSDLDPGINNTGSLLMRKYFNPPLLTILMDTHSHTRSYSEFGIGKGKKVFLAENLIVQFLYKHLCTENFYVRKRMKKVHRPLSKCVSP